eukprot:TRINITY_DN1940_c0_g1_i1.p1 TRINITY_DN1940_c0_g1~~TRINITY_DN1940_c0_g1_i1.p1  ORF type:complete len:355 (-),score=86.21 TRINITY_DN1940_c0_g1_i1:53-1117(-)
MKLLVFLFPCLVSAVLSSVVYDAEFIPAPVETNNNSTCSVYTNGAWSDCDKADKPCGSCFNVGSRPGVICNAGSGSQTGYLCPPEKTFACMDWTFGSVSMRSAESQFSSRTGDDVYFGVGTYGVDATIDPIKGLGACYRLDVTTMSKQMIVQSINTGSDVWGNQFDLQVGDGGFGAFDSCAGSSASMFPGDYSSWGKMYGGADTRVECSTLPPYPTDSAAMKAAGDSLVDLCEYSFDHGARFEGGANPTLRSVTRVKCPDELVELTQIQRSDDPVFYKPATPPATNSSQVCQNTPNSPLSYCLTRMMDCRKPSGAWRTNVDEKLMVPGKRLVQTCALDGYTRHDVQCGCFNCYC